MNHFKLFCKCGALIAQCKCFSVDNEIRKTDHCTHIIASSTANIQSEPITMESLLSVKSECDRIAPANMIRCHPSAYSAIRNYFHEKTSEEIAMGVEFAPYLLNNKIPLLGVDVWIDHALKDGEYRFERRIYP